MQNYEFQEAEIKVASLMALGESSIEIINKTGIRRERLQHLKRTPAFAALVYDIKQKVPEIAAKEVASEIGKDIRQFREDFKKASSKLQQASNTLMDKVLEAANNLNSEEISAAKLPTYLKAATESLEICMQMRMKALGLEELLEYTDEFREIIKARKLAAQREQSDNPGIESLPEGEQPSEIST